MALQTEVWAADIAANLFKDNEFIRKSKNDDAFVEDKIVHLNNSGTTPTVVRGRTTYPATITQRTDTETTYNLQEFTSNPTLITDVDAIEVNYEKRQNVLEEHIMTLKDALADYVPYAWCPTLGSNIVATTGQNRTVGAATGATGTRKKFTKEDALEARRIMDRMNVPKTMRVLLLPSEFYNDLMTDSAVLTAFNMNQGNLPEGVVSRIWGFDIMVRSTVAAATVTSNAVKDPVAATAATDNAMAIAWHPSAVRFALGDIKVYANEDRAEYYGSIFSAMVRSGASKARADQKGIVAIVEAP